MTEIKWIGTGANTSFQAESNWQGGRVPGLDDIAVFDSNSGNCTLTTDIQCGGLKLLTGYSGVFSQSGYEINIGNNGSGVFHVLKAGHSFNGNVNLAVDDFFVFNQNMPSLHFTTSCNFRIGSSTGTKSVLQEHVVDEGARIVFRRSPHPTYPTLSVFTEYTQGGGICLNYGEIDLTESEGFRLHLGTGIPTIDSTAGKFINRGSNVIPIFGLTSSIKIGDIEGAFSLQVRFYGTQSATINGDFTSFRNITLTTHSTYTSSTLNLSNAVWNRMELISEKSGNLSVTFPENIELIGDCIFTQSSSGKINISGSCRLSLFGTADQNIDIGGNSVDISVSKQEGTVTLINGNFSQTGECTFGDSRSEAVGLIISASFTGTFLSNNDTLNCHGFSCPETFFGCVDLGSSTINNYGPVNLRGTNTSNFLSNFAIWNQYGGTRTVPNIWNMARSTYTNALRFQALTFHERSVTEIIGNGIAYFRSPLIILGTIVSSIPLNISTNQVNVTLGANASVEGKNITISFYNINLYGNPSVLNVQQIGIYNGNIRDGGEFIAPLLLSNETSGGSGTSFLAETRTLASLELNNRSNSNVTHNLDKLRICDNVTTSRNASGAIAISGDVFLAGDSKQVVRFSDVVSIPRFLFDNNGRCDIDCHVRLAANSKMRYFVPSDFSGGFDLNGFRLQVTGEQLILSELDQEKYLLDGIMEFYGHDFVLKDMELPENSVLSFVNRCEMRIVGLNRSSCRLWNLHVQKNATLVLCHEQHCTVTGPILTVLSISGDLVLEGTLECPFSGDFQINMLGTGQTCQLARLMAGNNLILTVDVGENLFKPDHMTTHGDVRFLWNETTQNVYLAPGDYRGISRIAIPDHIEALHCLPGKYEFPVLEIRTSGGKEITWLNDGNGKIQWFGNIELFGNGICHNEMEELEIETLWTETHLRFSVDEMLIKHPIVQGGSITGDGSLIVFASQPFQIDGPNSLQVERLVVQDSDGSAVVPQKGYENLVLKAMDKNSQTLLQGTYRMKNLALIAQGHVLTIDVPREAYIHCSGNISTQLSDEGAVRMESQGTDQWVFDGTEQQNVDMTLEHGFHVLGSFVNSKSSGSIVLDKPLVVRYYQQSNGAPLEALANMTIVSNVLLTGKTMLLVNGQNKATVCESLRFENGRILTGGHGVFLAKLTDTFDEPIALNLIEQMTFSSRLMNPSMPYLHEARKTLVSEERLEIRRVYTQEFLENLELLPEGEVYNFRFDSGMFPGFRFEQPGLYYVIFGLKLFGRDNPIPFRYEIMCERPT